LSFVSRVARRKRCALEEKFGLVLVPYRSFRPFVFGGKMVGGKLRSWSR